VASPIPHPASLEQLVEVGRSGVEWMVKIPEGKGRSEEKDLKKLHDWFSLINTDKQSHAKASNSIICTAKLQQWPLAWSSLCQLFRRCA